MALPIEKEVKPEAKEESAPKASASVADIMGGAKPKAKSAAAPKAKAPKAKAKHKHTHIEHHDDGSHTVRHSGDGNETSYAAPDLDAVHDGLEQHIGDPNGGEGQAPPTDPMAAGGAPSAAPAPAPAGPAPVPQPGV